MSKLDLRYIIIKVKDLERAKKFYTKLTNKNPSKEEKGRIIVFDLGNIKIGLYNPLADGEELKDSDFGTNCIPSFGIKDFDNERKRISTFAKITTHKKVGKHEWIEFKDTEGNIIELHKK